MDQATQITLLIFVVIISAPILLFTLWPRRIYRCTKCGFETYSYEESVGHSAMENSHAIERIES